MNMGRVARQGSLPSVGAFSDLGSFRCRLLPASFLSRSGPQPPRLTTDPFAMQDPSARLPGLSIVPVDIQGASRMAEHSGRRRRTTADATLPGIPSSTRALPPTPRFLTGPPSPELIAFYAATSDPFGPPAALIPLRQSLRALAYSLCVGERLAC